MFLISVVRSTLVLLCFSQLSCGQAEKPAINKSQALRSAKIQEVSGWKEIVSDNGRYRILFPGEPEVRGRNANGSEGYRLINGERTWFVMFNDLDRPTIPDYDLRNAYRQSVQSMAMDAKVVEQKDVVSNGSLGTDVILSRPGKTSFLRAFLIGRRMYVLEVDSRVATDQDSSFPYDVQRFFDSFTFWE